jgi:hypothetical protein
MAEYFTDLAEIDRVDWPLQESRSFKHDPDDPGKKERYQAEALIWKHVPLDALQGVCCCDTSVEAQLEVEIGAFDPMGGLLGGVDYTPPVVSSIVSMSP